MTSPVTGVMTPYVTGTTGSTTGTAATTGTGSSSGSAGSSTKTDNSLLDPQAFC